MGCGASTPSQPTDEPTTSVAPPTTTTPDQPATTAPSTANKTDAAKKAAPSFVEDDGHVPLPPGCVTSTNFSDPGGSSSDAAASSAPAEEVIVPNGAIILVLGGPGCGKDTQCDKLAAQYSGKHLSAVDLLRAAVTSETPTGIKISNMIRNGQIVPAQDTLTLLKEAMKEHKGPYFVQGYPKTIDNLVDMEQQCGACSGVLLLECSDDELTRRLLERGKTSSRTDDTPEAIQRRLGTYSMQVAPLLEELRVRPNVLSTLDASQPVEAVFASAKEAYEKVAGGS